MPQSRQLAAIMFTDIVGYTKLMGEDEQNAFELLQENRNLQKPIIEKFSGRWIKELGDGVMASFTTVSDAINAAINIQQVCNISQRFQLRIGINLGEVVFENEDMFGDGVNIASRIQAIAIPGGIYISESVHHNISNKKNIITQFVKTVRLKNVKEDVRIYQVVGENIVCGNIISESQINISSEQSIAVLPFINMSNDPEKEYFSEGIAEEILNSLAHVNDLKVAGRSSSFQFKGKNISIREIGEKLKVQNVLEGSVRKQGNQLRITVQLINAANEFHLWSERYDREMDDIFIIQDEIALAVTEKLKITLREQEKTNINKKPSTNHEAYDLYMKGRFHLNRRGQGLKKALEYFQLALEKDPLLTLAYTGMAETYCLLSMYCVIPPHAGIPKARQFAEKAIQLKSSYAEAYTSLAFISAFYDWNWKEAKNRFHRLFMINDNYVPAHYWYCYYLSYVERKVDESINAAKKAAELLEPLVPLSHHVLSVMYINARQFEEGMKASKMSIELDANFFLGYTGLGLCFAGLNQYKDAIKAFKTAVLLSNRVPLKLAELCWAYFLSGNKAEVKKIAEELILRSQTEYISPLIMSCISYYSNNTENAFKYLEQAFEQHDTTLACIKAHPISDFLRTDSRFQPFIEKLNFPYSDD